MTREPYIADFNEVPCGILRSLALPIVIAGVICVGIFLSALKWLQPAPAPVPKVKWVITWVELTNFQKPYVPAQKRKP